MERPSKTPPVPQRRTDLGHLHATWQGWHIDHHGDLIDSAGNRYTPRGVQASVYARQLERELRRRLAEPVQLAMRFE